MGGWRLVDLSEIKYIPLQYVHRIESSAGVFSVYLRNQQPLAIFVYHNTALIQSLTRRIQLVNYYRVNNEKID